MTDSRHSRKVAGLFSSIAPWYDFLNHFLSLGQDFYWRRRLAGHIRLADQGTAADLAAGTMDVTKEILRHNPGSQVLALDYTRPMLVRGQHKLEKYRQDFLPVQADGRYLPLPDASVHCVSIAFGIRNIVPRIQACKEILRVLRPGGRLCILEFGTGKKRIWGGVYNFYLSRVLPLLGRLISRDREAYTYLAQTIAGFPDEDRLSRELKQAGFSRIFYYPMCSGIVYVHVAQKPGP
ncbi:ubiquinone/menaquinone biosynthesis methyltransferase [Desulfonatronospira thiodismutans ASO3-1]|uniref:Demethylmenaquinone methyltransferase n=1 Tax=Desulfonatronospira thiodismutans ASO3-1 TaxID=555779 RepID=D6SRC1_9BACT|nr:ubiquinone/menaquinone biosynthesis methyltransferase [Desulfonatronospira thiodismutans]EFI33237.1 ubiquinone/menaquinone biosynthesis methyltransferase [Desulfonatronospira thiodismutans ASO3-1]